MRLPARRSLLVLLLTVGATVTMAFAPRVAHTVKGTVSWARGPGRLAIARVQYDAAAIGTPIRPVCRI